MRYKSDKGHGHTDPLIVVAVIGMLAGLMLPVLAHYRNKRMYNRAAEYAAVQFGDKKAPLTDSERAEWFKSMGVEGDSPKYNQLNKYIDDYVRDHQPIEN